MTHRKFFAVAFVTCFAAMVGVGAGGGAGKYAATWESLDSRPVPEWWKDAKFGIFIFWGPYSVPAYAPLDTKDIYACYAEWYQGQMLKKRKNQTSDKFFDHHAKNYANMPYANFAAQFTARFFDPEKWAGLFKKAGARYVVLSAKHHDGYALWPSPESPYYNSVALGSGRDLVGELSRAVKAAGLRSGLYYSLIEYANPYSPNVEKGYAVKAAKGADAGKWALSMNIPQMKELVEDYAADILYPDGDWEATDDEFRSREFLQWLFNESKMKDSIVVNDRWGKKCRGRHGGYYTTEYGYREGHEKAGEIIHPWEECRGLGRSFGYNRFETANQYASAEDCIRTLADIISKGGNLLLDVGPDADGRIPPIMEERLLQIGEWLEANGEAIYGTRPRSDGAKNDGGGMFFTEKGDSLYAITMDRPCGEVRIKGVSKASGVTLLGETVKVEWRVDGGDIVVAMPAAAPLKGRHAWTFKVSGAVQPPLARFNMPPVKQLPKSQMPTAHAVRVLSWDGVDNSRDFGGLRTRDGNEVRRGLVYRSQAFNDNALSSWLTAEVLERDVRAGKLPFLIGRAHADELLERMGTNDLSRSCAAIAAQLAAGTNSWKKGESRGTAESRTKILRETGIRTEIDLRSPEEIWGMNGSPLGSQVRWINIPGEMVNGLLKLKGRQSFAECFRLFLDKENYPIDFHCIAGADRTGALALVLYGILGVSEDDILADYSLTSYSNSGIRPISDFKRRAYDAFASLPGKTLNDKAVSYVLSCGFSEADITRFREIMLNSTTAAHAAEDVLEHVDPFIGTEGKGNTLPGPTAPFALIQPGPDSGSVDIAGRKNPRYCNGYKRDDARIIGFTQTHLSGTGCPDLCDFRLLPFTGDEPVWGLKDRGTETSRPGYYSVFFTNTHVRTEITATRRCGVYRMTWAADAKPRLLVDLQHGNVATYSGLANSNHVLASSSRIDMKRRRLYVDNHVQAWLQNRHVAGAFEFSRPIAGVKELPLEPGNKAKRYVLDFDAAVEPLEIKVSVSGVDSAGAERNLDTELVAGPAFERVRKGTEEAWRSLLRRVRAKASPDALKLIYTALYHCFQQPNLFSDVDGRYRNAAAEIDHTDGEYYTGFSLWDTFRAVHPLYTILAPEKVNAFVNSFLSQYRSVGYLPTIPYFGRETFCMIGVHSIPVITDAWLKGFRGFDGEEALTAVTNALTVTHRHRPRSEWWVPDENWELLDRFGYYPWDFTFNQGVSRTLEIAYNEACASALARALGKDDVAVLFDARSHRWTNHFDRVTLLVRGRGANGKWREPFSPTRRTYCTQQGGDYTESNAREYTWFVPHDPMGLISAFGGKDVFVRELSDFFWKYREYRHDNEPGHQAPYQFVFAGRPDLTARIVRETIRNSYFATSHSMRGNDDCGQMSAWYLFSSFGFYPFDGFSATYVLGAPQIPEVTLDLPGGGRLHIVAKGLSEEAMYVRRVTFNGTEVKGPVISHAELMRGGELVYEMMSK